jgi:glycosyltransferase involved in cell wall biosynthesis
MACAKPVICSNVSDMKSFLAHSPNLLCDPQDVYSIKEALCSLLTMDAAELEALGIQNRAIAVQNFEKDRIVERYLLLLGAL